MGIKKIEELYYLSTSDKTQTGGEWKETQDTWQSGKYIWTRSKITWSDDNVTYTTPVLATGINNANSTAQNAKKTADDTSENLTKNYYTKSEINQTADAISGEVSKKVGNDEFGTKVEQNYEHVRIAWNKISEFIQFINAQLQIKDNNKKLLMALDKLGMHFYRSTGAEIGDIGVQDTNVLSFAARNGQGGMAWGIKYTSSDGTTAFYPVFSFNGKMVADSGASAGGYDFDGTFDFEAPVRLFEKPIYLDDEKGSNIHGDIYGSIILALKSAINGTAFCVDDSNGNTLLFVNDEMFQIVSDSLSFSNLLGTSILDVGKNVGEAYSFDFNNNSIINVDNVPNTDNVTWLSGTDGLSMYFSLKNGGSVSLWTTSSDKKLKKNIKNAETKAIDKIMKIKHRQFDWKANGEHQEIGYIAQEMQKIDNNFVHHCKVKMPNGEEKEDWQINVLGVLSAVTKGMQEQQKVIEEQGETIKSLSERLERLEAKNGQD